MTRRTPKLTPEQVKAAADRAEGIEADEPQDVYPDSPPKPKLGRPTGYKPEFCQQAIKLCLLGATDVELADFFKITTATLYRWKGTYSEFCDALKSGKVASDERVERSLYAKATGYTFDAVKIFCSKDGAVTQVPYREHVPPDTTACIFWLKNRRKDEWRDVQRHEVGKPGEFDGMTEDELRAFIAGRTPSDSASSGGTAPTPGEIKARAPGRLN